MKSIGKFRIHSFEGRQIMREERTIQLAEIPIGGTEGFLWNRLHGEREELCEALVKEEAEDERYLLQARLRNIDDALDRLMSGSALESLSH
jgi:hypothetical protein